MTILKHYNLKCEFCSATSGSLHSTSQKARHWAKRLGWKRIEVQTRLGPVFKDACPKCKLTHKEN